VSDIPLDDIIRRYQLGEDPTPDEVDRLVKAAKPAVPYREAIDRMDALIYSCANAAIPHGRIRASGSRHWQSALPSSRTAWRIADLAVHCRRRAARTRLDHWRRSCGRSSRTHRRGRCRRLPRDFWPA
jgi:hypothetical protein